MSVKQSTMKTWWFKNHWIYIHTVFHYNEPFVHLKGTMNDKRFFIEPYMPIKNLYTYTLLQSGIDKSTNLWSLSKNSFNIKICVYDSQTVIFDVLPNERMLTLTRERDWTESLGSVIAMFPREAAGTRYKLLSAWRSWKVHLSDHKHSGQGKHGVLYRQKYRHT